MAKLRAVECREFIKAVTEKAQEMRVPVAIAVVNAEGHLLAMERMDDAGFITPDIASGKAYTVAAFRSMSPRFPDGLAIQQWFKERNPQMLINASVFTGGKVVVSGGCAPIFRGDELIGAYGISGGTSDQDEVMAIYARQKVGWAHKAEHDNTPPEVRQHFEQLYAKAGLDPNKL
jgi:glc operon protein GlcG